MSRKVDFTYENSFSIDFINSKEGVADPFLIKVNGFYYLFYTSSSGLKAYKSYDLLHFIEVNHDGFVHDKTIHIEHAYAPEVFYFNGNFYLVTSPSGNGHYLFKSDSIEGPFKLISNNFHEMIDGSFFIDSDEKIYFSRAAETGIILKEVEKNFINKDKMIDFLSEDVIKEAKIGRWNEGPYLIKRYGTYFLTYTGTHFLSNAYRVEYVSGKSLKKLKYKDVLLLSTTKSYYGLGHSMNILGPNLDSYYIVYHNMMDDRNRYFNISRILFNDDEMMINHPAIKDNFNIERPYFEEFINEENYLSDFNIDDKFSIEFNLKGKEAFAIISKVNDNHYFTLKIQKTLLILDEILNNSTKTLYKHEFSYEVNLDVLHTIRVQYDNQKMALYFDNSELFFDKKIKIIKGKFGFKNNELKPSYLAYSKYAFGSSDEEEIYASSSYIYNKNRYEFFIDESQKYYLTLSTKNKYRAEFTFNNKKYVLNNKNFGRLIVDEIELKKGYYTLEFVDNPIGIDKIEILPSTYKKNNRLFLDYKLEEIDEFDIYHNYEIKNRCIYFENDRNIILSKSCFKDFKVTAELKVTGNPIEDKDFIGITTLVNNYAKDNQVENAYSMNGVIFAFNNKNIFIIDAAFNHSKILFKCKNIYKNDVINVRITKNHNLLSFYINNTKIFTHDTKGKYIEGKIGIYNNHASGLFKDIEILEV